MEIESPEQHSAADSGISYRQGGRRCTRLPFRLSEEESESVGMAKMQRITSNLANEGVGFISIINKNGKKK